MHTCTALVCCLMVLLLIYWSRRDGRLSWHGWFNHCRHFIREVVTCQPQIRHSPGKICPPKTDVLTTKPRRQLTLGYKYMWRKMDRFASTEQSGIVLCVAVYVTNSVAGCRGQTPADAEYQYLEHAKRLEMYGAHLFPAQLKVSRLVSVELSCLSWHGTITRAVVNYWSVCCVDCVSTSPLYIWNNSAKSGLIFKNFWSAESWGNFSSDTSKLAHLTWIMLPHYLVKNNLSDATCQIVDHTHNTSTSSYQSHLLVTRED